MAQRRRRWRAGLAAFVLGLMTVLPASGVGAVSPVATEGEAGATVTTDAGPVVGTVTGGYRRFQGIPYAAPPVGDGRWRSPRPVAAWTAPRDATTPGNRCPQVGDPINGPASDTEDCLYLSVTAPLTAGPDRPKPVLVWLHGGGLVGGAGSDYDARRLAVGGDLVVVAPNYRLGVFGFFGHPGLEGSAGFGLEDQQAALRWVGRNIAAFGGDPANVTLAGQSGGGVSVCAHLASPAAAGLFHRAIIQSGGCQGEWPAGVLPGVPALTAWSTAAEVEASGAAAAAQVGCADPATALACLRALPAAEILPATIFFARPGVGAPVLPTDPGRALRDGTFHRVPILSGHTRDEGTFWASYQPQPITAGGYRALLAEAFGDGADAVAGRYPVAAYATPGLTWAAVVNDRVWACPALDGHRQFAAHVPTFVYRFDDRDAPVVFPEAPAIPLGAYHGSEVAYLFGSGLGAPGAPLSPEQRRLSEEMIRSWARFAASGDPNGRGLPAWPAFDPADPMPHVRRLAPSADAGDSVDVAAEHGCGFWAGLAPAA